MGEKRTPEIGSGIVRRSFLKSAVSSGVLIGALPGVSGFGRGATSGERDFSVLDGKPSFDGGDDLGAYIWREGSRVKVRFSGNFTEPRVFEFSFSTNKEFKNVTLFSWNEPDIIDSSESLIEGRSRVRPATDGFGFDLDFDGSTTLNVDVRLSDELDESNQSKQQAVINAETFKRPENVYFGGDNTNPDGIPVTFTGDMPPDDPAPDELNELIDQKRGIAERITQNSLTIIEDTSLVDPVLSDIEGEVESNDLDEGTAENALTRLIEGEKLIDASVAAFGPGQSEYQNETVNLSKATASAAIAPAVQLIFMGIAVTKAARLVPRLKPVVEDAAEWVTKRVADLVGLLSPALERKVRRRGVDVGYAIFETAEEASKAKGQPIAAEEYREIVNKESNILIENSATTIFIKYLFNPSGKYTPGDKKSPPMDETAEDLVEGVDPTGSGSLEGSTEEAKSKAQDTLDLLNDTHSTAYAGAKSLTDIAFGSELLSILLALVAIAAGAAYETGIGALVASLAGGVSLGLAGGSVLFYASAYGIGVNGMLRSRRQTYVGVQDVIDPSNGG